MARYSVTDSGGYDNTVTAFILMAVGGALLYEWSILLQERPNRFVSALVYYGILCLLAAIVVGLLRRMSLAYRRTEIDNNGLVIHEGFCGLIWKRRIVPRSQIIGAGRYDGKRRSRSGFYPVSGIRILLADGSAIVLTESSKEGMYHPEIAEVRSALEGAGVDAP